MPSVSGGYEPGTSVSNGTVINETYDDLLAIWDAYNGSGTSVPTSGIPTPWLQPAEWPGKFTYWSANKEVVGFTWTDPFYYFMDLYTGGIGVGNPEIYTSFVVLEFVEYVPPQVI